MRTDDEIRNDVIEEVRLEPQLADIAPRIGVTVKDEVVTLSGVVDHYTQKLAAEKAAQRVKGVKVVAVDIEVKGDAVSIEPTDAEIGEAIRNALAWHSAVNQDQIEIVVDNGWVELEGAVNWDYERKAAEKAIQNIRGVKGVVNKVRIKAKEVDASEIKSKIGKAFYRHASVDADNISVEVHQNMVTLKGKVSSWVEREEAEDVAWSMPGVTQVVNNLVIDTQIYAGQ
ncbi:transport-associated protein [Fulvivirga imtechensis AK7]|uniref:Transport-associated protein n=1 Tax=Fulvivirga imtechensis AK7 TaxID=1237149 RepID=L8JXG0_9BACT|nr:BON domain-containing protein [Fulvivirga imtechensis]ELR71912.1 transport-associated protein [Fulvivirga imtechensis AK7]